MPLAPRTATVSRRTRESLVEVGLSLDGTGRGEIATGIGFLDHMLDSLARHARFDLTVRAEGDLHVDQHHTAEDVGITLGQALDRALGERRGIRRFGDATVPLDEALSQVAVDLGGRGWASIELPFHGLMIGGLSARDDPAPAAVVRASRAGSRSTCACCAARTTTTGRRRPSKRWRARWTTRRAPTRGSRARCRRPRA